MFAQPVDVAPVQGYELAGAQACPQCELHHVARLAGEGAQMGAVHMVISDHSMTSENCAHTWQQAWPKTPR
ncbi:DUF7340 domain-containing protein [Pseudomonas caspiana]